MGTQRTGRKDGWHRAKSKDYFSVLKEHSQSADDYSKLGEKIWTKVLKLRERLKYRSNKEWKQDSTAIEGKKIFIVWV